MRNLVFTFGTRFSWTFFSSRIALFLSKKPVSRGRCSSAVMHLSIYLSSAFFIFVTLRSRTRIVSDAKTIGTSKSPPKTDSTKITSRSTNGASADRVFVIGTDAEGKTNHTCRCVLYHWCDTQDAYYPSASESHIKCGNQEACCTRPLFTEDPQSATPNSKDNSTDICVAPSRCDQRGLADNYGYGELIERTVFSECTLGKVKCPADKVLPNVFGPPPTTTSTPSTPEECVCTVPNYCNATDLPQSTYQCDVTEICCPTKFIRTVLDEPLQPPPRNFECGIKKEVIISKLADPSETIFGEFPWMVLILERVNKEEKVQCGGSIVSANLVLTAAHCVQGKNSSSLIIRAGEYDLRLPSASEELPHQDRQIKNISIHHAFYRKLLIHDLALIELGEPFQYSSNVAPVCLPLSNSLFSPEDTSDYDLDQCIATGWGSKDSVDTTVRNKLGKIDLKVVPSDLCVNQLRKSALGSRFNLHESLICAQGKAGTDTCKGDGGGPLICPLRRNSNKYVQIGVTAGGLACTSPFPGLYASLLLNNSAWIAEEILFKNVFFF